MAAFKSLASRLIWDDAGYITYGVVMFVILFFGFLGNLFTVVVLRRVKYSGKLTKPLMLNLAIGSLIIIVLGYPPMMMVILSGTSIPDRPFICRWYAFVNGTVGIANIATLTEMSLVLTCSLRRLNSRLKLPKSRLVWLTAGSWLYGICSLLPPLLGWGRFVPGAARISCNPDWTDQSPSGISYNVALMVAGFYAPLALICCAYFKAYRILGQNFVPQTRPFQLRRKLYITKLLRMTVVVVIIFVLSWGPYAIVSAVAIFKGQHVLTSVEAEIPELMAKASVVYNPVVYTVMNDTFRSTLYKLVSCKRYSSAVHASGVRMSGTCRGSMAFVVKPFDGVNAFTGIFVVV